MTFGSCFSGIGGLDLGLERSGWECVWQVEKSEFCRRVLAKHWPDVRRHDDINTFPPTDPEDWGCDAIFGGFPCKQTSTGAAVHGRRLGLEGPDSGLWFQMLRVVRLVRPAVVVVENVSGAATWSSQIEDGLAEAGFHIPDEPLCLSAEDLGAPHRRRRLFWIAHRDEPGLSLSRRPRSPETRSLSGRAADRNDWLSTLPGVLRVADGIPGGLDRTERIIAIGNAVVPAVGECLGRTVLEMMEPA